MNKYIYVFTLFIMFCTACHASDAAIDGIIALQQKAKNGELKPYLEVKPVAGETKVVRMYYATFCPYSQQYLPFFKNLAVTGQEATQMQFEITPVINSRDGVNYAIAYAAVRRFYPNKLYQFVNASIVGRQKEDLAPNTWKDIDLIAKKAGVTDRLSSVIAANKDTLTKDVVRLGKVQKGLGITNTPSIAIAGTYIATPEITNGDSENFSKLVNSLISMVNY